jgi:hypothetical protein
VIICSNRTLVITGKFNFWIGCWPGINTGHKKMELLLFLMLALNSENDFN